MPGCTYPSPSTFGQRVQRARERSGKTRATLGGLVGRSAEWVKAIETGRLKMPRLPLLLRLAEELGVDDLAELTGDERLAAATYTKAAHKDLPAIKAALTTYHFANNSEEPLPVPELEKGVTRAWCLWHNAGDHRSSIAPVLPGLLANLQHATRAYEGKERRRALAALAQAYHLAQLFLSFQPSPESVMLTGDRAMMAAQEADDPHAIAVAAWYLNHVFRDAGERSEARVDLAMQAADLLNPERGVEDRARWGLLHLAAALSYAKVGKSGNAWRHWDQADRAAKALGEGYSHPFLIFGRGVVDAYAITMQADLLHGSDAVHAANINLETIPSATRRSFHLVESARAYGIQGEDIAVVTLLKKAHEESPETVRFNLFARSAVSELSTRGNALIRRDAEYLRQRMNLPAVA
ncbi:helix-turn-helix domain-containing protein [Streptomyces triculaminicus]|uniref:Helix-turn-helix domain-containing protein n=2 Tax=Streptomyces TaxID=1883 RepID=A0A939FI83_9ACTN|nr:MULTISPECIES: helix-turn-helix transcriptional regulator [Streptomyces]MBO0651752.1 helix-turn-helix domain-containing protein [Streptomyces triculaminicus]QSY47318.1 helix-turn-helix domain-containing protein [Streptomyces griseocarneus]